jgi:hypothetical protein
MGKKTNKQLIQNFLSNIDKKGPDDCWEWQKCVNHKGYGCMGYIEHNNQKFGTAHRLAYALERGPIPDGLCVLHSCHNPRCCNVKHLRLGTNSDNNRDREEAGRTACGEKMPRAKLTADDVCVITTMYLAGYTMTNIAKKYMLTQQGIDNIICGKTWKHITGGINRRSRV